MLTHRSAKTARFITDFLKLRSDRELTYVIAGNLYTERWSLKAIKVCQIRTDLSRFPIPDTSRDSMYFKASLTFFGVHTLSSCVWLDYIALTFFSARVTS